MAGASLVYHDLNILNNTEMFKNDDSYLNLEDAKRTLTTTGKQARHELVCWKEPWSQTIHKVCWPSKL